jgi:hypothetical protein
LEINAFIFSFLMLHIVGNIISSIMDFRKSSAKVMCPLYEKRKKR